ncbi:MAG: amidohydrolase family protein [Anaerolineae bacterium]|nr:amidohydrolase family protein [Anaerolineae bacterium]
MFHSSSALFNRISKHVQTIPVIDCHEHMSGPEARLPYKEPVEALIRGYVFSDLQSAAFGVSDRDLLRLQDPEVSTDEKWPLFERLWHATEHTAYARVTKLLLKEVYGQEELTRAALDSVADQLANQDEASYFRRIDEAGIQAMLVDVLGWLPDGLGSFLDGRKTFPDKWRLMISLPGLHPTTMNAVAIQDVGALADMHITSLDEYLEAVFQVFQRCIERGVVGIKDQSAYTRNLSYDVVPKAEAETQFNLVLGDPRNSLGWPQGKPLNDFLFHQYMRFARDLDLPVQIHTGHMAGIRNRVDKTNAAQLTSVLELHRDVNFDLFHGNWPYLGDLLFLGKNYPNVALDCCWLHIIDPAYAAELLKRSVFTLPHTKVHGFGGDYGDSPEYIAGHLRIARENIAATLSGLVECGWLEEEEALSLAADWLFNNPNRFFKLGFDNVAV